MKLSVTRELILFLTIFHLSIFCSGISLSIAQTNYNTELLGRWGEGTCNTVKVDSNYIYMGRGSYVEIYENSSEYQFVSRLMTPGIVEDIIKNDNYLYIANEQFGLRIIDISDINSPVEISYLLLPGHTLKLMFYNNSIFTANFNNGLRIINIENPLDPFEVAFYDTGFQVLDLDRKEEFVFITQSSELNSGFVVLDISDPNNPIFVKKIYTWPGCIGLAVKEDYLYVICSYGPMSSYSIIDPRNPIIEFVTTDIYGKILDVDKDFAFVLQYNNIRVVDISNPDSLYLISEFETFGDKRAIAFNDEFIYIADSYYGLVIIDVSDIYNPVYVYQISTPGATEYLVAEDDLVYLSNHGLRIIDVSNPSDLRITGEFETIWGTDKIFKKDNLIFLIDGNISALRVLSVEFANNPIEISQIKPNVNLIISIAAYENYIYLAKGDSLDVWDITSPYFPVYVTTLALEGYCHELLVKDCLLISCQDPGGVMIYNLSDPANPNLISSVDTQPVVIQLAEQDHYIIGGTPNGFKIIDLSDPYSPNEILHYPSQYTYDLKVLNNFLYVAHADDGIRIFDLDNITSPQEVGYYNTPGVAWSIDGEADRIYIADARYGMSIVRNMLLTGIREIKTQPSYFELFQNFPNPFNSLTHIRYSISKSGTVLLKVFDILGNEVVKLVDNYQNAGEYDVIFQGDKLASGIYLYRLTTGSFSSIKKLILLK